MLGKTLMNKTVLVLLLSSCLVSCTKSSDKLYQTNMDSFTSNKVSEILREKVASDGRGGHGELVDSVSSAFLSTPYQANTLIGSPDTNEVLVADFNGVDCFTLLDYVEALTRSKNKEMFLKQLVAIRYAHANVEYFSRKHFFTDWFAIPPYNAVDVTHSISPEFISVQKSLNGKADGGEYISGLGIISRTINYVPGHAINAAVLDNLRTGDYVGVY